NVQRIAAGPGGVVFTEENLRCPYGGGVGFLSGNGTTANGRRPTAEMSLADS
ncbi:MAG TPA: manganese ABC transporter ATP-binding protein, partial [Promineifilum sp.]|nr:manganese ABC transporter ATP-binding protein [Promineifilum sp.]